MGRRTVELTHEEWRAQRAELERRNELAKTRAVPRAGMLAWTLALKPPSGQLRWFTLVAATECEATKLFRKTHSYDGPIYAGPLKQMCSHARPELCRQQALDARGGWLWLCAEHWDSKDMHDAYVRR